MVEAVELSWAQATDIGGKRVVVADGAIAPGGSLPVNTNGGSLSCAHPGMYGLFTMVEAAQQIMGVCGERQVAEAELALSHGNGGEFSSEAVLILGSAATAAHH
jgi:acetyl-CoA acetyltransferase